MHLMAWVNMARVAWLRICCGYRVNVGQCINPDVVHVLVARPGDGVSAQAGGHGCWLMWPLAWEECIYKLLPGLCGHQQQVGVLFDCGVNHASA